MKTSVPPPTVLSTMLPPAVSPEREARPDLTTLLQGVETLVELWNATHPPGTMVKGPLACGAYEDLRVSAPASVGGDGRATINIGGVGAPMALEMLIQAEVAHIPVKYVMVPIDDEQLGPVLPEQERMAGQMIRAWAENADPGDTVTIEAVMKTPAEVDALPEYDG